VDHDEPDSIPILIRCWPLARLKGLLRKTNKQNIYCAVNCQVCNTAFVIVFVNEGRCASLNLHTHNLKNKTTSVAH